MKSIWLKMLLLCLFVLIPGTQPALAGHYNITFDDPIISEGGDLLFSVELSDQPSLGDVVTIGYTVSDGTATTADNDYTQPPTGSFDFDGSTANPQVLVVPTTSDSVVEADETIQVDFTVTCTAGTSPPCTTNVASSSRTGTIENNDVYITAFDDVTVAEAAGTASLTVRLNEAPPADATFNLSYAAGSPAATDGADYSVTQTSLTIPAGNTEGTVNVTINNDAEVEEDEVFTVTLSPTSGNVDTAYGGAADPVGEVTVTDDDVYQITLAPTSQTVSENGAGPLPANNTATFTISIDASPIEDVTVNYQTTPGSAVSPDDFTALSGSVTFSAGTAVLSQDVSVTIVDDELWENDESLSFSIDPSGANFIVPGSNTANVTVTDNDVYVTSFDDVTVAETAGTASLTVRLNEAPSADATFNLSYAAGSPAATVGVDYSVTQTSLTVSAGNTEGIITVTIDDDTEVEEDEVFTVTLSPSSGNIDTAYGGAADPVGEVTITNDDVYQITLAPTSQTVSENGTAPLPSDNTATFTVSIDSSPIEDVTIPYQTTAGSADATDFVSVTGSVTFATGTGTLSQDVPVTILDDVVREGSESFSFSIDASGSNFVVPGSNTASVTVTDNDYEINISPDISVDVDDGTVNVLVQVLPAVQAGDNVIFSYATNDGSATAPSDYTSVSVPDYTFTSASPNPLTIPITILNDGTQSGSETFTLDLSGINSGNATFLDNSCQITINDHAFNITAGNDVTVNESDGTAAFTVVLDRDPIGSEVLEVDFTTVDGIAPNAAEAGLDFTATTGTLTIDATDTANDKRIIVPIIDDDVLELQENYRIELSNPSLNTLITDNDATGYITDNDYYVTSFADAVVDENIGTLNLTVNLDRTVSGSDPDVIFSVAYGIGTDTATLGSDYTAGPPTLTISSGSSTGTLSIPITDDSLVELAEIFTIILTPTSGNIDTSHASAADLTAEVTINIDERYQFAINDINVVEAETTADFTVTLVSPTPLQSEHNGLEIIFSTQNGSATSPDDYDAIVDGTVAFSDAANTLPVTVQIHEDTIDEGAAENFFLNLTGSSIPEIVEFVDNQGVCIIQDTDYIITPSWNIHGTVTLESPVGTAKAISSGNPVAIDNNEVAAFTVIADYRIHSVTVNGVDPGTVAFVAVNVISDTEHVYTFDATTPQGAHTIDVIFDHQIEMTSIGSGTVTHDGSGTSVTAGGPTPVIAEHGADESFSLDGGSECVVGLEVDGVQLGAFASGTDNWHANTYTFPAVTDNHEIIAAFGQATITVNLGADDGATGTDADLFIQDNGQSGASWRAYVADASYTLGALIAQGVHGESFNIPTDAPCDTRYIVVQFLDVDGWLRPADVQLDLQNNFFDQTVEGLYDANSHVLTIVAVNGQVTRDPVGDPAVGTSRFIYPADSTINLTAIPDADWFFQDWQGDVSGIADTTLQTIAVTMDGDRTIEAVFVQGCTDADGDGYTTDDLAGIGCVVTPQIDCDDTDPEIYPGAVDICEDGIDQNCSGGDDPCSGDESDDDGDGYTEVQGDCDDTDSSVYPGAYDDPNTAADEDCYDGPKEVGSEILCVDASDIPVSAARRPAPPMIMFLLDDSGSMDWEFMTRESNQLYEYRYYVHSYHFNARAYDDISLSDAQRREWLSQWTGYNRIYFDPNVTYSPWPKWEVVANAASYSGSEAGAVTTHENSYDADNATFPDRAYTDGFTHADMDAPRLNTTDSEDGHSWSHTDDDGNVLRFNLNDEFMRVIAGGDGGGQQIVVTRDGSSSGSSTTADAIGLSVRNDLELTVAHQWYWYDNGDFDTSNDHPEIIFDDADDSSIYTETANWYNSGGDAQWEWAGEARWAEDASESATWKLNLTSVQEGDYYVYAWVDDYGSRDDNARYDIFYYDASDTLQSDSVRIDQSPTNSSGTPANGARWVRLTNTAYHFSEQGSSEIIIPNAHYYTWNDANGDGVLNWTDTDGDGNIDTNETLNEDVYLVTIPGAGHSLGNYELHYYLFSDVNSNFQVEDGELVERTGSDIPTSIIPVRRDEAGNPITNADELAYMVRQDFADWFSFYRRRMLTAKAAVGLTVYDMERVELGVHTINRSYHEPLSFIIDGNASEMNDYLATIYDINPVGGTPLRRGLHDVGKYFESGDEVDDPVNRDYVNLSTLEGLCSGDESVFYDADDDDDADSCDDSGGGCQRAYVIAMTDGYYNGEFDLPGTSDNVDGASGYVALRDASSNSVADIAMRFYETDLDPNLVDEVPASGFDEATWQHMVTYSVSFGVYGRFDPELFPDCLPACDTPGEEGCPELSELTVENWAGTPVVYDDGAGPFDEKCPDWHNFVSTDSPNSVDDLFHASVNGRGKFLNAANPDELVKSMQAIRDLIDEQTGTAASVAINANKIQEDTLLFQTEYNSGDWSGDILAKCLDITGELAACDRVSCENTCNSGFESCMTLCTIGDTTCENLCITSRDSCLTLNACEGYLTCDEAHVSCVDSCSGNTTCINTCDTNRATCEDDPPEVAWSADAQIASVDPTNRNIITYDTTSGIAFTWSTLPTAMKTSLLGEEDILDYLRGERQYERQNDTGNVHNYRNRSSVLGDFINSEPYHYENSVLGVNWVIAGANDGMLHVFDADTGDEVFAYVPNMVFPVLHELTLESFTDNHKFFVDGYITVQDLGDRVILVAGLGKGGKGFFALDLTAAAASANIESDAANIVLWEYSPDTMAAYPDIANNLGYSYSRPQIVRSNDSSAARVLVFSNGYESANQRAVLFLVGLDSFGAIQWTRMIDTGIGDATDCNGLSTPAIIYPQGDGRNDFIYAGDLLGNLWKFNISDTDRANWSVYFNDGTDPQPLFQARSNAGYRQPITMQPDVTTSCAQGVPGYLVAFGTGRLLDPEVDAEDHSVQTVYGIWDWSAAWIAEGHANPEQTYLGAFEADSGPIIGCTSACDLEYGNAATVDTCVYDCDGNTECIERCDAERASCISNCSTVRTLSHMDTVIGDSTAADHIALLRQTQIYAAGLEFNSDGELVDQEYGATDLDAWDEIVRVISDNQIDWMVPSERDDFVADTTKTVKHVGWYFDLPGNGERIIRDMTIVDRKLVFTSSVPSDSPCESGGVSHHWVVEVCSGGRTGRAFFDISDDDILNQNDYINIGTLGNPIYVAPSSIQVPGLTPSPTLVEVEKQLDRLYFPDDEGGIESLSTSGFGIPIQFWRELDWQ